jgi:hypothetical protein
VVHRDRDAELLVLLRGGGLTLISWGAEKDEYQRRESSRPLRKLYQGLPHRVDGNFFLYLKDRHRSPKGDKAGTCVEI